MKKSVLWLTALILSAVAVPNAKATCDDPVSVCLEAGGGSFALIEDGRPAAIFWDVSADPAVRRVAASFADDLERVSGHAPQLLSDLQGLDGAVVIIGELGKSPTIDDLVRAGKLDVEGLTGQWEAFRLAVVESPWPNVAQALVIAGSDRRGAVFGAYDLSEQIGVSPWYWFADVPVEQQSDVFVTAGVRDDRPEVKYRGFFINDENPSFNDWAYARFGGINAEMYEHVFELILRLKGNYLWPAMWLPKAFHVDDPNNTVLADEMGIVVGTTHHEPMNRAHAEWTRKIVDDYAGGDWNYRTNAENLRGFWRYGIERMMAKGNGAGYESVITVGMRGDGDEAMAEGTAIQLLETIVADQRQIITDVTGKPAAETPQIWALYKEVQDYYDKGMTVPDDVTLLFADDNWGQIRRLPTGDLDRPGGYGVYYHFDYVGGPRNYKWLNTVQIQKVWQQMDLAYERGARELWIVNVGDIKPMEYPLDFFMEMAWDPEAITPEALETFPERWAEKTFGVEVAEEVAGLVTRYSKYAARRKPELISADTWPLGEDAILIPRQSGQDDGDDDVQDHSVKLNVGEFGRYVDRWRSLVESMERTKQKIRPDQHAAWFQLVEFPILALSNLYEMYYAVAWNRRLAAQDDPRANFFADAAEEAFMRDAQLAAEYHALKDGKWVGMMSDVHMNYVIWQTPDEQTMPEVVRVDTAMMIEASDIVFQRLAIPTASGSGSRFEASNFDRSFGGNGLQWTPIPHLGQSDAAIVALPQGQPPTTVDDGVRVEYDFTVDTAGSLQVTLHLTPTLDTIGSDGLRIGVSLDEGAVTTVTSLMDPTNGSMNNAAERNWVMAVIDNGHEVEAVFDDVTAGQHTLKIWRLDDNVVIERIAVGPKTESDQPAPGFGGPIELNEDDKPAFPAPPAGWDVERPGIAHGTLEMIEYDSETVGTTRKMLVYTPPDYTEDISYPVLYLLHGIGGDETEWNRYAEPQNMLDNLIADGNAEPMIIVMPNGRAQKNDRAEGNVFASAPAFAKFEGDLFHDVIPAIESRYSTKTGPKNRALAGLSMGGGQSLNFGLTHLDRFGWIGGFSSAPNTKPPAELLPDPEAAKQLELLWLSCGSADGLFRISRDFHAYLSEHDVSHVWHVTDYNHEPAEWKQALYWFVQQVFRNS